MTAAEAQNAGQTPSSGGGSGAGVLVLHLGASRQQPRGGLSQLAPIGIVAVVRRHAEALTPRIASVTSSVTSGVQFVTAFAFGVQVTRHDNR